MANDALHGRILVLDDDRRVRQLFEDCLTWLGYRVDGVSGGPEALALLKRQPYDLLLTDLALEGMNGLEVARTARALRPALPIVVVSGTANGKDLQQIQELSFAFLSKSVDLHALESTIRGALARHYEAAPEAVA